jgi:acyl transferase domain-containing protein/thioesterase domain-containing protein/acyl carrier protein
MAAHLPGAADIEAYWRNLRDGHSAIRRLSEDELREAGENPGLMRHRDYVPFAAPLEDFEHFDAEFFGFSPKEAAILDPQHRQFLETAWEALENAGHTPEGFDGQVGVFAGCGMGSYFYFNLCSNPDLVDSTGMFLLRHTGNDKDFLTTRLSHVLDLRGPSVNLQTACSTSLVATHYAVQALLNGECDMALAGGVTIELPHKRGYLYKENEILSPNGTCHAFDHRAKGTVFGSGAGTVVLRRAQDAIDDGDHIWAIIKGSAVNNDGAQKAGYLAPSVDGQAKAIREAQDFAGVSSDSIDYVECHGTGTYLGDPIEVAALTQAFAQTAQGAGGQCRIGSVKTNIGHLDTAAGVASLIKTSLALHHHQIPASLGFEAPNPAIDFASGPFVVNDRLSDWPTKLGPRLAGVNSLGVGGTNAHVVLQEAPARAPSAPGEFPFQILPLSGRSKQALEDNADRLAQYLRRNPHLNLADVSWTLSQGRRGFDKRMVVVASSAAEAARLLSERPAQRAAQHGALESPEVVFMFPGGGAQYAGMARDLYETEPVFADRMDRGLAHLDGLSDQDIRALWLAEGTDAEAALTRPSVQLPLIMVVEYALAQLWISWGVTPSVLTGHSMGENTAACLAGVMSFEDCIGLVHLRGQLFEEVSDGGMLSVALPAPDLQALMGDDLDLAAVNAPGLSVASGPKDALAKLAERLAEQGIDAQPIAIDIAAHSRMLEPIEERFRQYLKGIKLQPPQIPMTSNRSGQLISDDQATSPDYWVAHLRGTVQFAKGLATLARDNRIFFEVGPGQALSSLARQHPDIEANQVLSALRHPKDDISDDRYMVEVLGRFWALGLALDWTPIWGEAPRQRLPLPGYAFQRSPYFVPPGEAGKADGPELPERIADLSDWGWQPNWVPKTAPLQMDPQTQLSEGPAQSWLFFMDAAGYGARAAKPLRAAGHRVIEVWPGDTFARLRDDCYALAPEHGRDGYDLLVRDLTTRGLRLDRIAHFWLLTQDETHRPGSSFFHRVQEQGVYSLLFLAQAIEGESLSRPLHITAFTNGAVRVAGEALPYPAKATLAGPARVIPKELSGVTVATLDLELPQWQQVGLWRRGAAQTRWQTPRDALTQPILEELLATPQTASAALRQGRRYEKGMRSLPLPKAPEPQSGGAYLITGGFGGIGLALAQDLSARGAKIALLSRQDLPARESWPRLLEQNAPSDPLHQRITALQSLEASGAEVMVVAADVCDKAQMQAARQMIETRFGRLTGVIHGAGVVQDAPLLSKTSASVENVFTPKIHGTEVLGKVFPDGAVDWMVLFSSSSTVTAPAGQVDYVAANAYLNAFAQSRAGGKTRVVALNWGIWSTVGMAAQAMALRTGDLPQAPKTALDLPLWQQMSFDHEGNRSFEGTLSQRDWIISEHRTLQGDALLPGTGYLSLLDHALQAHRVKGPYEINDMSFLRALHVPEQGQRQIRGRLIRNETGYGFDVLGDAQAGGRSGFALCAQAQVSLVALEPPAPVDLITLRGRCGPAQTAPEGDKLQAAQEALLRFGPRWRVLESYALGENEGIADLSLPDVAQNDAYRLHPALMDIATGWAMELIRGYAPTHLWVPVRYGQMQVFGALPKRICSWVRNAAPNHAGAETARFDITLCDSDGTVLVEIRDFTIRRLDYNSSLIASPPLGPAEIEQDGAPRPQPLSPSEERLAYNLSQGILPDEGVEAFHRVLALSVPQAVVSSMDLPALVRQAEAISASATAPQSFDRPTLESDFAAPETPVQEQLAQFWQDLLGVANVGIDDSFFDLGGHSLIAVRLFAMVKKAYQVDFPISILFEAPTIRACAALIEAETVVPLDVPAGKAQAPKRKRRFKHIVPMHDGDGGDRQPFFLVAGMFGNVLNLRHLAHLLGNDRPFYGLQAKGLLGGEPPHETIEEAARDYLEELRQIQPQGPYMLGGFSGGGLTAYEMAQQLRAMGEEVSLLVLLDTPLPQRRALSTVDRAWIKVYEARARGIMFPLIWLRNRLQWELYKHQRATETSPENTFHNAEIEAAFYRAIARYQIQPWDGPVQLYRPPLRGLWKVSKGQWVNDERSYVTHDNDWGPHVPNLEVVEVPGDHDSMVLEPNVRVLARRIRDAIEAVETPLMASGHPTDHRRAALAAQ